MSAINMFRAAVLVFSLATLPFTAFAHDGATGVIKERMDAMASMAQSMKSLTAMMRGKEEYDAQEVRALATSIANQSGDHLLSLFPEGSQSDVSEAKSAIWTRWRQFETYANELSLLATGLANAADNGKTMSDNGGPVGMATMMGGDMTGGGMMGGETQETLSIDMLSTMPATAVFRKLNQNCTACHSDFRSEKK